jgi:hypothetical protein
MRASVDLSDEVVQRNVAAIGAVEVGPAIGAEESVPEVDGQSARRLQSSLLRDH